VKTQNWKNIVVRFPRFWRGENKLVIGQKCGRKNVEYFAVTLSTKAASLK
jgi:hypothetical protein